MKGNVIRELRKVVSTMYEEGHARLFALSVLEENGGIVVQAVPLSLNVEVLDTSKYRNTYSQAMKTLSLVKDRCGSNCTAISAVIGNAGKEELQLQGNVLRVLNLNDNVLGGNN